MLLRFFVALACTADLLIAQHSTLEDAWNLAAKGEREQAIAVVRGLLEKNPRDADARLLLGSLLMEEGNRQESIAQLTEAVRLRPQSADAQNALGEAYNSFGDPKAARGSFEKAVALNPKFGVAQMNLGRVLLQAGELEAAAQHLDRAIALLGQPEEAAEAWSDLGEVRRNRLDDAGALAAFERAVQLNPSDAVAQYRLGAAYLRQGKLRSAEDHLKQAYRLNPNDQSVLNSLQIVLRQEGKTEEAKEVRLQLTQLLRKSDQTSQNALAAVKINNDGAALEKSGDLHGALEKYREALNLNPDHVGVRVNYAVALLRLGQWTEGLAQLQEALRRDPDNPEIKAALKDALAQAPPGSVPR